MFKKNISIILILTMLLTVGSSTVSVFADAEADTAAVIAQESTEGPDGMGAGDGTEGGSEGTEGEGAGEGTGEGSGDEQGGSGEGTDTPDEPEEPVFTGVKKDSDGKWRYYVAKETETGTESVAMTGTGWIKVNGVRKYYRRNGVLVTGWQTIKYNSKTKYKYHFGSGKTYAPAMSHGYKVLSGKAYYFNNVSTSSKYGKMATSVVKTSKGSVKYFPRKDGTLKTGWVAYKGRAYYMFKKANKSKNRVKGGRAFNYKVNRNITIGKKGYIGGQRGEALAYAIKALNKNGWSLKSAYTISYRLKYANRPYRPKTVAEGAIYGFSKGKGNCYVMNCCFHVMADLMGYNVRQIKASVGPFPHSWLEIKQDGKWWVYDANFRNETGRNGFKIYYGKPGTWRYTRRSSYLKKY